MTRTEHARQIDAEEFRCNSEQSLQRALAYSQQKQAERRRKFLIYTFGEEGNAMALDTLHAPTEDNRVAIPLYAYGRQFFSAAQWAHRLGIEPDTLFRLAKEHGSIEAAIRVGLKNRQKNAGRHAILLECNGLKLTSHQWAKRLGITISAFRRRKSKYGIESAVAMGGPSKRGPRSRSANDNARGYLPTLHPLRGPARGQSYKRRPI